MKSFSCPSCGSEMAVKRLACRKCDTVVEGTFGLSILSMMSDKSIDFIEIFVRNKGNMRKVSEVLGLSYPTARNELNKVVEELESLLANREQQS